MPIKVVNDKKLQVDCEPGPRPLHGLKYLASEFKLRDLPAVAVANEHLKAIKFKSPWNCVDVDCKEENPITTMREQVIIVAMHIAVSNGFQHNNQVRVIWRNVGKSERSVTRSK